jgi:hypothetical protein
LGTIIIGMSEASEEEYEEEKKKEGGLGKSKSKV